MERQHQPERDGHTGEMRLLAGSKGRSEGKGREKRDTVQTEDAATANRTELETRVRATEARRIEGGRSEESTERG